MTGKKERQRKLARERMLRQQARRAERASNQFLAGLQPGAGRATGL